MKHTRRRILKLGGVAAGGLAIPNYVEANKDENYSENIQTDNKVRLRATPSDPLDPTKVHKRKHEVLRDSEYIDTNESLEDISTEIQDNKSLIAYNFDIVEGRAIEWKGTVDDTGRQQPGYVLHDSGNQKDVSKQMGNDVLQRADKHANELDEKRNSGQIRAEVMTTQSNKEVIDDWGGPIWSGEDFHETSNGNKAQRTLHWAKNPDDEFHHALNSMMWVRPNRSPDLRKWEHTSTLAKMDWVQWPTYLDHGPGNSIGSNADYTEIGTNPTDYVSVLVGKQVSNSNLDIDDKTDPSEDLVKHKFDIGGDLKENYVEFNLASTAKSSGERVVETKTEVNFDRAFSTQSDSIEFTSTLGQQVDDPVDPPPTLPPCWPIC